MTKTAKKRSKSHIKGWITRKAREAEEERLAAKKRKAKAASKKTGKPEKKGVRRVASSSASSAKKPAKKASKSKAQKGTSSRKAKAPRPSKTAQAQGKRGLSQRENIRWVKEAARQPKPRKHRKPGKRTPKRQRRPELTNDQFASIPKILGMRTGGRRAQQDAEFVQDLYWTREDGSVAQFPSFARLHPERDAMFKMMQKGDRDGRLSMIVRLLARQTGLEVKELYTLFYSP